MSESMNDFAVSLYRCLSLTTDEKENVFFSPASIYLLTLTLRLISVFLFERVGAIYVALSMTYCGARNNTADQMKSVLKLDGNPDDEKVHSNLNELWKTMLESLKKDKVQSEMANHLWIQKSFPIEEVFQEILKSSYKANAYLTDFIRKPEQSRLLINVFVETHTSQKIKDLLAPGTIKPLTRLVIINAIYFKGKWVSPFKEFNTRKMPFHITVDESHDVQMMFQKKRFTYTEDINYDCKVLILPYVGCQLKMVIILPNQIDGLGKLEERMCEDGVNKNNLLKWVSSREVEIKVLIPRFKFTQSCNLNDTLKRLGMTDLFSEADANLSGISKNNDLYVSEVVHKAFVEVNEEGTEAAAATAVLMHAMGYNPRPDPVFQADHPFMFAIFDSSTEVILFLGRVCKP